MDNSAQVVKFVDNFAPSSDKEKTLFCSPIKCLGHIPSARRERRQRNTRRRTADVAAEDSRRCDGGKNTTRRITKEENDPTLGPALLALENPPHHLKNQR